MDLIRDLKDRPIDAAIAVVLMLVLGLLLWPLVPGVGSGESTGASAPTATPTAKVQQLDAIAAAARLRSEPYEFTGTLRESLVCSCGSSFTRSQNVSGQVASTTRAMWTTRDNLVITSVLNGSRITQRGGPNGDVDDTTRPSAPLHPASPLRIPTKAQISKVGSWSAATLDGVAAKKITLTVAPATLRKIMIDRWGEQLQVDASAITQAKGTITLWVAKAAPNRVLRQVVDVVMMAPQTANGRADYERHLDLVFTKHGVAVTLPATAFEGTAGAQATPVPDSEYTETDSSTGWVRAQ